MFNAVLGAECCAQVDSAGFSQCEHGWSWCHDWAQDQAWGGHSGWRYARRWKGPWTEQAQNLQLKRRKLFRVRVSSLLLVVVVVVVFTAAAVVLSTGAAAAAAAGSG